MDRNSNSKTKQNSTDRISQLPELIQHHILTFLEKDQVARTSVLSKVWRSIVQSFAVLEFDQFQFRPRLTTSVFMNLVEESVHKFIGQTRSIQRFSLHARFYDPDSWDQNLNQWMQQVVESKVKELSLLLDKPYWPHHYVLPPFVFWSETITHLRLSHCKLGQCTSMRLPNLLQLNLLKTFLSNEMIHEFTSGCPSLETLKLFLCNGISRICVLGLAKLNKVELGLSTSVRTVKVVAPNLRVFKLLNNYRRICDTKIDLLACESTLRKLRVSCINVIKEDLKSLVSKFLGLEEITLDYLLVESIEIPNQKLHKFKVIDCPRLERVEMYAPNLRVLKYHHNKFPFYHVNPSFSVSNMIDFYATFTSEIWQQSNKNWLASFKELVPKVNEFENIKLIVKSYYRMDPIVCDAIDDSFLKLLSDGKYMEPRIEVLSKNTLKENGEPNCCRYKSGKCWKHHLYDAEMIDEEMTETLDLYYPEMMLERTETSGLFKSLDATRYDITRIKLHWI